MFRTSLGVKVSCRKPLDNVILKIHHLQFHHSYLDITEQSMMNSEDLLRSRKAYSGRWTRQKWFCLGRGCFNCTNRCSLRFLLFNFLILVIIFSILSRIKEHEHFYMKSVFKGSSKTMWEGEGKKEIKKRFELILCPFS